MSEQAIETIENEEIETETEGEEEQSLAPEEPEEVEIVLDGEEEPASNPVPKGFIKRIGKLNGKVDAANQKAEELARELEAERRKAQQLEAMLTGQAKPNKRPRPEDFDTDEEYEAAAEKYEESIAARVVQQHLARAHQTQQQQTQQKAQQQQLETGLHAHYERAESLKVADYETTEDRAIEVLGNDVAKHIMANTDNSEVVLYHLGKNPAKAQQIAEAISRNPIKGLVDIGVLASRLQVKTKSSLPPEPETQISQSGGTGSMESPWLQGAKFE